jgi:serine/threonine protein kinase
MWSWASGAKAAWGRSTPPGIRNWIAAFALKLPKPELVNTREGLATFRNEASTLASLGHPNITRVYASGTQDGQPYFAMEFLEGGSLDEEQRPHVRSLEDILALMLKIAKAVRFAHGRGVLHCDLKAANVLFDAQREPYVCDFGLARKLGRPGVGGRSLRGGTRGWMAPEQLPDPPGSPPADVSPVTDVFSLGVLLHWLLEGNLPFGDGIDYAERVRHQPRPSPGPFAPGLRWALRAISHKAMQAEAGHRYASATEFVDDLERAEKNRS